MRIPICLLGGLLIAACSASTPDGGRSIAATAASLAEERSYRIWRRAGRSHVGPLKFVPLTEEVPGGSIQLDNGVEVDAADWPATLVAHLDGGGYCTASVIGPRALLTAAHCVDLGKEPGSSEPHAGGGTVEIAGRSYALSCEMERSYAEADVGDPRSSSDYALCALDRQVPVSDFRPETISTATISIGGAVLLAGYGCTGIVIQTVNGQEELTYKDGDGILRMGDEKISFVGDRASSEPHPVWITTQNDGREPTLCPGDSGGPVFQGATLAQQRRSRRVVAVNSAVGWARRPNGTYRYYSFLSPLGTDQFKAFLSDFVNRNSSSGQSGTFYVCGYNRAPGIDGCRA